MSDAIMKPASVAAAPIKSSLLVQHQLMKKRNAAEARFKIYGVVAIVVSLATLFIMLWTIFSDGISAFRQATLTFPVTLEQTILDPNGKAAPADLAKVTTIGYGKVLASSFKSHLAAREISTEGVNDKALNELVSRDAPAQLRNMVLADPSLIGKTIDFSGYAGGRIEAISKAA